MLQYINTVLSVINLILLLYILYKKKVTPTRKILGA